MDADAELDAALRRKTRIAFDHAVLDLDGAADRIDHASELDDAAVAGALHHAPVMYGDGVGHERPSRTSQTSTDLRAPKRGQSGLG
jgi:hypothetical protein